MGIKILKRSELIRNEMFFIILSILFLHTIISFDHGKTVFEVDFIIKNLTDFKYLLIAGAVTLSMVYIASKRSALMIFIFSSLVGLKIGGVFFTSGDKLTLFFLFFYICISYFFIVFWKLELREPFYVPGYSRYDIETNSKEEFPVVLNLKGKKIKGSITNASKKGCFVKLKENLAFKETCPVALTIHYSNCDFTEEGLLVSSFLKNGVGIRFANREDSSGERSWGDFFAIIRDRGFF